MKTFYFFRDLLSKTIFKIGFWICMCIKVGQIFEWSTISSILEKFARCMTFVNSFGPFSAEIAGIKMVQN